LTKKLRTPLDLSLAASLSHTVPATNQLKLGPLLGVIKPDDKVSKDGSAGDTAAKDGSSGKREDATVEDRIMKIARWAEGPINKYGGPYMMVHWASGLTVIGGTTYAVHHGLDIMALLNYLPFVTPESDAASFVSHQASCIAGATVLNTLSLPVRLYLMSMYARGGFVEGRRRYDSSLRIYRSWLRAHLRSKPDAPRRLLKRG
ncbi:MAG: hypothetical protein SGPRY_014569, partial [Prymnesium sp.]